jgi:hypothetical protein
METDARLTDALNSLRNPDARAGLVVELLTKPSEVSDLDIDGLAGDSLMAGVGYLFKQRDFQRGFEMARKGGALEDLVPQIEQASLKSLDRSQVSTEVWLQYGGIPPSIRDLPGFNLDSKRFFPGEEVETPAFEWARALKKSLITEVLLPAQIYSEALQQMQQVGGMEDEMQSLILNDLDLIPMARAVYETGLGFGDAVRKSENLGAKHLTTWLKKKHVEFLLEKRKRGPWVRVESRSVNDAIYFAGHYFGEEKKQEVLERAAELVVSDFEVELSEWRRDLQTARKAEFADRSGRIGLRSSEELRVKKERLERARVSFSVDPPQIVVDATALILKVPEEKREDLIQRLYDSCDSLNEDGEYSFNLRSLEDAFAIATCLNDQERRLEYGLKIMNGGGPNRYYGGDSPKDKVRQRMRHLVSTGTFDERFRYVKALSSLEAVKEAPELRVAELLLSYWIEGVIKYENLMRERGESSRLPRDSFIHIAKLAEKIGMRRVAREFYSESGKFTKAAEQTDDSLTKARFLFKEAGELVGRRIYLDGKRGHSLSTYAYDHPDRMNAEINLMEKAIGLVEDEQKDSWIYHNSVTNLATQLFERREYQEGVLLMREAGVSSSVSSSVVRNEFWELAEASNDFAGCYWLSTVAGDEVQASKYKVLAEAMNQSIHTSLQDYIWEASGEGSENNVPF